MSTNAAGAVLVRVFELQAVRTSMPANTAASARVGRMGPVKLRSRSWELGVSARSEWTVRRPGVAVAMAMASLPSGR